MSLSESLRRLPEVEPPPGGWAELARRMDAPRARRRRTTWKPVLLAAAASAVITSSVTVQIMKSPDALPVAPAAKTSVASNAASTPPATMRVVSNADPRLARLVHRSQELERLLTQVRPETNVWDASLQARTETIERGLAYVDLQLNYAQANGQPEQCLRLWENRVQLMSELVATHRNARLPASAGPENSI